MATTSTTTLPVYVVDAFSATSFAGNPAAVVLISPDQEKDLADDLLQSTAAEMNLSETAFVYGTSAAKSFETENRFRLRWFTPQCEVALCGHATLASAAVLFNELGNESREIAFETLSGSLPTRRHEKSGIKMEFPLNRPEKFAGSGLDNLARAVVESRRVQDIYYSPTTKKVLIRLDDRETKESLESLHPNPTQLMISCQGVDVKGVIVTLIGCSRCERTADGSENYDFISRYFAPWVGINEDPVTGSAHTVLAPYWSETFGGVKSLKARQCSRRGGDLELVLRDDDGRVDIIGKATTVLKGKIHL